VLFNLYIDDIFSALVKLDRGCL